MKYIVFEDPSGLRYPILFPEVIGHDMIARSINAAYPGIRPVSAGFCSAHGGAWGNSVSLGLKYNPVDDKQLIMKTLGIEG